MIIPSPRRGPILALGVLAAVGGTGVALQYHWLGLTLSHYDARGHLVVARRIIDSITPGWQQIGAVWLPLPHLLNALPVQIDAFYRTGASAVAISIASFSVAVAAIAWIVAALTGSLWAGAAGAAVFALNPNVLYLQSTPMTEPLLVALTLLAVALLVAWCRDDKPSRTTGAWTGIALALACLTRYEAWPVAASALAVAAWARWRAGDRVRAAIAAVAPIAAYPAAAVAAFAIFSRIVVGTWFADDFFVPENPAEGHPLQSVVLILWGTRVLSGYGLTWMAGLGAVLLLAVGLCRRCEGTALLPLALLASASVPWTAFLDGHPYRIRYMVPLLAAEAVCAGVAAGYWRRGRGLTLAILLAVLAVELHPLDASAPMVTEAQWDRPNIAARDAVTRCLAPEYRGDTVMVSMGSLGHYMQDLSRSGFQLRDFLHEGNGDIWLNALHDPRPYVGWILVEEKAEGGDMLAKRARENPAFLAGFSRVCEAAGLALYRRHLTAPVATAGSVRTGY